MKNERKREYGNKNPNKTKLPEVIRVVGVSIVAGVGAGVKLAKSEKGRKMIASGAKSLGKVIQKL